MIKSRGGEEKHLLLVAGQGILDVGSSVADGLASLVEHALAIVGTGAGGVAEGLAGRLVRLGLDGAGGTVEGAGDALLGLLRLRLGGIGLELLLGLLAEALASEGC